MNIQEASSKLNELVIWIKDYFTLIILLVILCIPYYIAYNKNINKIVRFCSLFFVIFSSYIIYMFGSLVLMGGGMGRNYIVDKIEPYLGLLMLIFIIYTIWYVYSSISS